VNVYLLSLLQAAKDIFTWNFASRGVAKQRMDTCNQCPAKHPTRNQCTACGCVLYIKTKLKNSECPMDNWEK
jgi:hypothetical protein